MTIIIIILVFFLLLCCIVIFYMFALRSMSNETFVKQNLEILANELEDKEKKISKLIEIEKLKISKIPWWERSVSTIGVLAFISMTIATSVQTTNSILIEHKLEKSKMNSSKLTEKIDSAESLIKSISHIVLKQRVEHGQLDKAGKEVLLHRLSGILFDDDKSNEHAIEAYNISMALGKYDTAIEIIEEHEVVFRSTLPSDQVSLAEYYYLIGLEEKSKHIVERLSGKHGNMSKNTEVRSIFLRVILNKGRNKSEAIREVQSILNVSKGKAKQSIEIGVRNLEVGAVKLKSEKTD